MFITTDDGTTLDLDLALLGEVSILLDGQLDRLEIEASRVLNADGLGIYDSADSIVGLGFAACQTYMSACYGQLRMGKQRALEAGPGHRSGYTIAQLVNHAANLWKHREEWQLHPNSAPETHILQAFSALGVAPSGYPLSNALKAIVSPGPARLRVLLPHLEAWRDALAGAA